MPREADPSTPDAVGLKDSGTFRATAPAGSAEAEDLAGSGRRLLCRSCGTPVTDRSSVIQVDGAAVHRRRNPAGFEYEFACFAEAPGVRLTGQPTEEHTWFAGRAWTLALCRGCGQHLGWGFEGSGDSFFGLILEKLADAWEDGRGPH